MSLGRLASRPRRAHIGNSRRRASKRWRSGIGVLRAPEGETMNIEKFTERSQGFIQAAQGLAQRRNHQRLMPEHLLEILLDDKDGLAANLIRSAGGDPAAPLRWIEAALDKLPR